MGARRLASAVGAVARRLMGVEVGPRAGRPRSTRRAEEVEPAADRTDRGRRDVPEGRGPRADQDARGEIGAGFQDEALRGRRRGGKPGLPRALGASASGGRPGRGRRLRIETDRIKADRRSVGRVFATGLGPRRRVQRDRQERQQRAGPCPRRSTRQFRSHDPPMGGRGRSWTSIAMDNSPPEPTTERRPPQGETPEIPAEGVPGAPDGATTPSTETPVDSTKRRGLAGPHRRRMWSEEGRQSGGTPSTDRRPTPRRPLAVPRRLALASLRPPSGGRMIALSYALSGRFANHPGRDRFGEGIGDGHPDLAAKASRGGRLRTEAVQIVEVMASCSNSGLARMSVATTVADPVGDSSIFVQRSEVPDSGWRCRNAV
jgi:hypothetical protein